MTTVYDNFTDPVTGAVPAGRLEYRNVVDRDNVVPGSSSVGSKTVAAKTIKAVLASDGSVSTVLEPGPYLVRSVFDGSDVRTWRDIIVPASGSFRLQVLKDSFTQAPSAPAAVAALLALLDARFPSQSAIDAQIAALKALIVGPNAPETLDSIAEIAAALGNNPQAISNLVTAVAGKAPKVVVAAVTSTPGPLGLNTHTPVSAAGGPVSMSLPTNSAGADTVAVEKTDSSANAVTITGNIRGVAGASLTLAAGWQRHSVLFISDASGSWWPVAGHIPKSVLDAAYAPQSGAGSPAAAQTAAQSYADGVGSSTLTTATGRAVAFSIALGG